nr:PREDICTED: synaptonemal complex protein 3-like [Rhinolophus sinicus]
MEDVGDEFQNMLEAIKGDVKKIFHVRKMRFLVNTTASIKTFKQKVEQVGKNQQEQRKKLFRQYSQEFQTFFQEWSMDVKKTKEEEEKLANSFREHRELFHQARVAQNLTQGKIKDLYKELLKSMENLEQEHERFFTDENSEFRKEMAKLENRILVNAQQHELAII